MTSKSPAIKLLKHTLKIIKTSAETRDRPNLKQQIEQCQSLVRMIEREINEQTKTHS